MYRQVVILLTALWCFGAFAHDMTPTYPEWQVSHMRGIAKVRMELFNKRADVEYYEIGVFDAAWNPVPFVSNYRVVHLKHLGHLKFDVYVHMDNIPRATYLCSLSKLRGSTNEATISSKVCSKFR